MTLQWALGQPCNMNLNATPLCCGSTPGQWGRQEQATPAALTLLLGSFPRPPAPFLWRRILTTCSQRKHGVDSKGRSLGFVVKRLLGSNPSSTPSSHMPLGKGCHILSQMSYKSHDREARGYSTVPEQHQVAFAFLLLAEVFQAS